MTVKSSSSVQVHSVHFQFFDDLVCRKRLVVERNGQKFGPHWYIFSVYRVLLTVKSSNSVWGHSVDFQFLMILYLLLT